MSASTWSTCGAILLICWLQEARGETPGKASPTAGGWNSGLSEFFKTVDSDGDGQIEPAEAMRYIGDSFGPDLPEQDRRLAVQQMSRNLDGSDSGFTVSKAEVEQHLRTLLKVRAPATWLETGSIVLSAAASPWRL